MKKEYCRPTIEKVVFDYQEQVTASSQCRSYLTNILTENIEMRTILCNYCSTDLEADQNIV